MKIHRKQVLNCFLTTSACIRAGRPQLPRTFFPPFASPNFTSISRARTHTQGVPRRKLTPIPSAFPVSLSSLHCHRQTSLLLPILLFRLRTALYYFAWLSVAYCVLFILLLRLLLPPFFSPRGLLGCDRFFFYVWGSSSIVRRQ